MYYRGENGGFAFWRYDLARDENTWTVQLGFGGPARRAPREGYLDPRYRFQIKVEWRALKTCFNWWVKFLGIETQWHHRKGVHTRIPCGAIRQYRIHSFLRWPIAATFHVG